MEAVATVVTHTVAMVVIVVMGEDIVVDMMIAMVAVWLAGETPLPAGAWPLTFSHMLFPICRYEGSYGSDRGGYDDRGGYGSRGGYGGSGGPDRGYSYRDSYGDRQATYSRPR